MQKPSPDYQSHLGVYALIPDAAEKSILLIRKGLGCYTGLYDLPGGSMDPHETPEETLLRETFEETLCRVTAYSQLGAQCALYPYQRDGQDVVLRHIGITYLTKIEGTPTDQPAGGDSLGCVWVPIADIKAENSAPLVLLALDAWRRKPS